MPITQRYKALNIYYRKVTPVLPTGLQLLIFVHYHTPIALATRKKNCQYLNSIDTGGSELCMLVYVIQEELW
jgi:hypothetical protein